MILDPKGWRIFHVCSLQQMLPPAQSLSWTPAPRLDAISLFPPGRHTPHPTLYSGDNKIVSCIFLSTQCVVCCSKSLCHSVSQSVGVIRN